MNFKLLLFIACVSLASCQMASKESSPREKIVFNDNWKFHKGDVANGQTAALNDSDWRNLSLPHDWSVEGPFSEEWASGTGYLPGGIGWYRKSFTLPDSYKEKQVTLYFDGVYKNSEVWINGHYLGKRPNGFTPFYYDITPYLNTDKENVVAVKADHTAFADSRWYTGSGINRNVYLIATDAVHVPVWGVAFTTPEVSEDQAAVTVDVSVVNSAGKPSNIRVVAELVDREGKVKGNGESEIELEGGDSTSTTLKFKADGPHLWSVEDPYLYQLKISLFDDSKKTDELSQNVGIREFHFDADKGFFLNGKNMKLKGVCIHDDAGALGTAVPKEVWRTRLEKLKEAGCNSIRMSHNPHADYLYDLCDEMGFLVQDEAFDEWEAGKNKWIEGWNVGTPGKNGYNEYFKEWAERDLRDMILSHRNHPSIIMWSIGNEIDYPNDPYTNEILNTGRNPQIYGKGYLPDHPPASRLGEISQRLVKVAKAYDTSRPITAALAGVVMSNLTDYPGSLDIVGYNYQEYRYPEDHEKYPNRVIYGSENGKSYDAWMAVKNNDYISAQYLWTGIDYLGEARSWPSRSNEAGLLDLAGFRKPEFYFRKSLWTDEPMVYISTVKIENEEGGRRRYWRSDPAWNYEAGDSVLVKCYTNAPEAELFLNGESLGKKSSGEAVDGVLFWKTLYQPGELKAVGYQSGKEVDSYVLKTAGNPAVIDANAVEDELSLEKQNIAQIEIFVNDEKGTLCYGYEGELKVNVEGPAKLIGLENGSSDSHEDYKASQRKANHGKLKAYVQATGEGTIKVTVSGQGLKEGEVAVKVFD